MANNQFESIGKYRIYLNETYYLTYTGKIRELSAKDTKEWNRSLTLPLKAQLKEQHKIGRDKNPNMFPVSGRDLLQIIKDIGKVPFFDKFFNTSHILRVTDPIMYEAMKQKNYNLAKGQF